ncbi:uncharacterized protein LOC129750189 [Uranotaenia lowii]|uniref:uncharacterized protein LOC129750189 n=1 Tax=Uranotaenia lowii TaxID=190385 RepID=UPI00247850DF|nr:uncharacterized protein LOC129750189 [Uranotaenia lowii]
MTEYVPPQLITVLKTYQDNAPKGLHGPGLSLVHPGKSGQRPESPDHDSDEGLIVQPITGPLPMPAHPIMTTPDPDCGVVQLTMLEGKKIGCFLLGGEMRLCLPQIFNNILMDFSVEQINRSIQELMIYLYNCTDQQLQEFKRANIIPDTAKTCGLITRTNAERLCSYMLHQADGTRSRKGATSFRVYHRCFGKCEGIFTFELYSYKEPACIECCECQGMFSPQKFVCHQHDRQENRTCHWGFNSSNWRAYIHVALDEENREAYAKLLEDIWNRERDTEMELEYWLAKRKGLDDGTLVTIKGEPLSDIPLKKPKLITDAALYQFSRQPSSAFRPWTQKAQKIAQQQLMLQHMQTFGNGNGLLNGAAIGSGAGSPGGILTLSREPPVLQNPESVVRLSESDKFERSFQPNVALAPRKTILCKEREREQRERLSEKERSGVIKCDVQIKQESPPTPPVDVIRSVIKCEVNIKQERPATPPPPDMSPGPQVPSAPQSPTLPPVGAPMLVGGPIKSVPMSYSPVADVHSGSNEITSSTSPVPPLVSIATINGCISEKPKLLVKEQISPPSPGRSPLHSEDLHHHHRSHQPPVILKNGNGPMPGVPGVQIAGNPEFELSTDTDDDSLAGEPDSSNNSPLELIGEVMKDVAHETRDQILHIFKLLIQETTQIRNDHIQLMQDQKQKDALIADLQRDKDNLQDQVHELQQQLNRSLINIAASEANALQMQHQHQQELAAAAAAATNGSAPSSTPPSPLSLASNGSSSQIIIEKIERRNSFPEKSDVIMKPLKKSLRRSPDDSVLMLQSPPPPPPPPVSLSITTKPSDPLDDDKTSLQQQIASSPAVAINGGNSVINSPSPRPPSRPASTASTASNASTGVLQENSTGGSRQPFSSSSSSNEMMKNGNN